jgi:hypothetical protein
VGRFSTQQLCSDLYFDLRYITDAMVFYGLKGYVGHFVFPLATLIFSNVSRHRVFAAATAALETAVRARRRRMRRARRGLRESQNEEGAGEASSGQSGAAAAAAAATSAAAGAAAAANSSAATGAGGGGGGGLAQVAEAEEGEGDMERAVTRRQYEQLSFFLINWTQQLSFFLSHFPRRYRGTGVLRKLEADSLLQQQRARDALAPLRDALN